MTPLVLLYLVGALEGVSHGWVAKWLLQAAISISSRFDSTAILTEYNDLDEDDGDGTDDESPQDQMNDMQADPNAGMSAPQM